MHNNHLQAKIIPPQEIEPLIYNDMKFTAPHDQRGFIEVWDSNTDEKLWDLQVYKEDIDPLLESDVQWVFITKLEIKNSKPLITNSNGEKYLVDIEKRAVENYTNGTLTVGYIFAVILVVVLILFIYFIIKKK